MARYVCARPCWHGKRKWRLGDEAEFEDNELPRNKKGEVVHFSPAGKKAAPETTAPASGIEVNVNERKRKVK